MRRYRIISTARLVDLSFRLFGNLNKQSQNYNTTDMSLATKEIWDVLEQLKSLGLVQELLN